MAMEEDAGRGYCYARRESTLKHILCGALSHPSTHLQILFTRPALRLLRIDSRDMPLAQRRLPPHPHSARRLAWSPLRAANEI